MKKIALFLLAACLLVSYIKAQAQTDSATLILKQSLPRKNIRLKNDRAANIPKGPYSDTWKSLKINYQVPEWIKDAKFGIFIHFGSYTMCALWRNI